MILAGFRVWGFRVEGFGSVQFLVEVYVLYVDVYGA